MEIKIRRSLLIKAKDELDLTNYEEELINNKVSEGTSFVKLETNSLSVSLLSYLLKNSTNIANKIKANLSTELLGENIEVNMTTDIWETKIRKIADVIECFTRIGIKKMNADILFLNNWYPIIAIPHFYPATRHSKAYLFVSIKVNFCNEYLDIGFNIETDHLIGADGKNRKPKLKDLFAQFGCRPQKCIIDEYKNALQVSENLKQTNKQMLYSGNAFNNISRNFRGNHWTLSTYKIGGNNVKEIVIIESELEYEEKQSNRAEINKDQYISLPIIRVFSMLRKKYLFVRADKLEEYIFNQEAYKQIFLPKNITEIIKIIISTPIDDLTGDILENKHGGMIILASGSPGIGKTSTAEVYSEMQQMPLYQVGLNELGTYADHIEEKLNTIFKRVEKWNAIVLFDEIDIFLAKREKSDLNRAAIVGVFLRLMDYFKGVMFLTSNRPEVLDFAIHSRITLKIKYPDLDANTREKIWIDKSKKANLKVKNGFSELAKIPLNGREIRNFIRLAKTIYPKGAHQSDIIELIDINNVSP
jgi:hypothetical protein